MKPTTMFEGTPVFAARCLTLSRPDDSHNRKTLEDALRQLLKKAADKGEPCDMIAIPYKLAELLLAGADEV